MGTSYYHPRELEEAAALLEEQEGTVLVNGGSDIILSISVGKITPTGVIDMRDIKGMNIITDDGQYVHIGGNVTHRQMQGSPACGGISGLARAAGSVRSPVTHIVATPAGNIATAAPPADCVSMMLALDAGLVLVNVRGERVVRQKDMYLGAYKTDIQNNEIIKEMQFPSPGPNKGSGYARFSYRRSRDIVKIITGTVVTVDKKRRCLSAAISLGALNVIAILTPSIGEGTKGLGRDETVQLALKLFPREAGLRESYFRRYKEKTTCNTMTEVLDMAFAETERGDSYYACGLL